MSETTAPPDLQEPWEPRIVAFFCNWCTYTASDLAGTSRLTYAPNTRVVRLMCSGRLDPEFVLTALRQGADGVLIGGCRPGDCHYQGGNYKCLRRFLLIRRLVGQMGIEPQRVRLEWIAASEGDRVQKVTNDMVEQIRRLGPLKLPPIPQAPPRKTSDRPAPTKQSEGKPKVGFYWCASCGGCEESVVDLAEDILGVVASVDFVFFPVAMDFKRADVEAMADGEMAVCFINGAIRTSEQREMAELLRRKAQILIAYGSCSCMGGVPGLANLQDLESIMQRVYHENPSIENPQHTRPLPKVELSQGDLHLPTLDESVKTLDQTVPVDYYLPGCSPPVALLKNAVQAILSGQLPPKGAVLAPDKTLCEDCPRIDSKPEKLLIQKFRRPHEIPIDPQQCLLAQGLLCLGPATRGGCDAACVRGNMPCTGCMGPVSRVRDHGAAALSALASLIDANEEDQINSAIAALPDPVGTFYRYGVPASLLFRKYTPVSDKRGEQS
jgi:F420-non-reducing hydrogenase small subunit